MSNSDTDRIEPSFDPGPDQSSRDSSPQASNEAGGQPDQSGAGQTANAPMPDTGDPGGSGRSEAGSEPTDELDALRAQINESQERYLRAMAEMENVRRRAADDVAKAHKFSIESFARELLPVHDSLEMALSAEAPTVESIREGVEATLRQMASVFERNKLVEINPLGQKFDPNHHQAISMVPATAVNPPVEPNHVATVLQKGYLINERVLRPALVTVAEG